MVDDIKPRIIVLSSLDDTEGFKWMSDGWYSVEKRGTERAERLMEKAHQAIEAAADVKDAIERLQQEGFEVVRDTDR